MILDANGEVARVHYKTHVFIVAGKYRICIDSVHITYPLFSIIDDIRSPALFPNKPHPVTELRYNKFLINLHIKMN